MTPESVMTISQSAMYTTVLVAAPMLVSALVVGILVGMFQAMTQINEMTLSFIPKLLVLVLSLLIAGPWILTTLIEYTTQLFQSIPDLIG